MNSRKPPSAAPVAIIGMACRFPLAHGPQAYWELLRSGIDAITMVPPERFPLPASETGRPTRWAGLLDDVKSFDAAFFGIAPRSATSMDPQQRLLLETAWEAVEDAGLPPSALAGSRTGVFVGGTNSDYWDLLISTGHVDVHSVVNNSRAGLAGRISYALDLRGPAASIDTACCASLSALHLARQSLLAGESRLAIAGGVHLVLGPHTGAGYADGSLLSPDGRCKFGDAAADGFVRSDGVGVVVLKPLADAVRDGDPVRAVLLGSATNNDGRDGQTFAAPTETGQLDVLARAYEEAGVNPADVDYLEAHGTGTSVGDPIEISAALKVLGAGRPPGRPLLIGSAKTNIGHCEAAAGMAGLIKAVLCLQHREAPPSLHFTTPNPRVSWHSAPARICGELTAIPDQGRPMIAGVTSLGITGTNAHVVLGEHVGAPVPSGDRARDDAPYLLVVSAKDPAALDELSARYERHLRDADTAAIPLGDICRSAGERRAHHNHRLAVAGNSAAEVAASLAELRSAIPPAHAGVGHDLPAAPPRLAFVFSGQGARWAGTGLELLEASPAFAAQLRECDAAIQAETGWSLLGKLADGSLEHATPSVIQPALWAIAVSLAVMWRSWGVTPSVVIGHSMGEIAAACAAGMLTSEDGAAVICRRAALIERLRGQGGMAVAALAEDEAEAEIAPFSGRVVVAAVNSPRMTALSGDVQALDAIGDSLQRRGVAFHRIGVDYASHAPHVDPVLGELVSRLSAIKPVTGHAPLYSTVTGQLVDGRSLDAGYWARNLREKVRLAEVVKSVAADDLIFLEISPHPVLLAALSECLRDAGKGMAFGSLRNNEPELRTLLTTAGHLYTSGCQLRWAEVNGRCTGFTRLPAYPWRRDRFWPQERAAQEGGDTRTAEGEDGTEWELDLDTSGNDSYLNGHQVQGVRLAPGAMVIDLALAASRRLRAGHGNTIRDLRFHSPIIVDGGTQRLRMTVRTGAGSGHSMELYSRAGDDSDWIRRASATLTSASCPAMTHSPLCDIRQRCTQRVDGGDFYEAHAALGIRWADCFQGIRTIWRRDGEAVAEVCAPPRVAASMDKHVFHPALLDACLQVLEAAMGPARAAGSTPVVEGIDAVRVVRRPGTALVSHAVLRDRNGTRSLRGDVRVHDPQGELVAEVLGIQVRDLARDDDPAPSSAAPLPARNWTYELKWRPRQEPPRKPLAVGRWLVLADHVGVGADLARRLQEAGSSVILVVPGTGFARLGEDCYQVNPRSATDFRRVLANGAGTAASPGWASVVHLWSLSQPAVPPFTDASIARAIDEGCRAAIRLVQAIHDTPRVTVSALWLVTRGCQPAEDGDAIAPLQAPIWGLGRTIIQEHPELSCRLVDLAAGTAEADSLLSEMRADDGERQVAVRGTGRYAARLVRVPLPATASGATLTAPAVPRPPAAEIGPLPFLAAYYALCEVGQASASKRVLIHCAGDGIGLAAVQIAQWKGAQVFATAETEDERAQLRLLGARCLSRAGSSLPAEVMGGDAPGSAGMDIILDTLAGDHTRASLQALAPYGHYLELSTGNVARSSPIEAGMLAGNRSFTVIDIAHLAEHRADRAHALSRRVRHLLAEGVLSQVPGQAMPAPSAAGAAGRFRPDATYLVTGGLGGTGFLATEWLASNGARHLLLLGRSPEPSASLLPRLEAMRASGVSVRYEACDVADTARLRQVITGYESAGAPRIAGVMHAAGVLRLSPVARTDDAELDEALGPKVYGACNLHQLLADRELDFFVLFSSASSIVSAPLAAGYSAANAFLDGLAAFRSRSGQTVLSVNWGFWDSAGMAARVPADKDRWLAPQGVRSLTPEEGMSMLSLLPGASAGHVVVMPTDWEAWRAAHPAAANEKLYAELLDEHPASRHVRVPAATTPPGSAARQSRPARHQVGDVVTRAVSRILQMPAERMRPDRRLASLGFDSLMAAELCAALNRSLGVNLPAVRMLGDSTLQDVITMVTDEWSRAGHEAHSYRNP